MLTKKKTMMMMMKMKKMMMLMMMKKMMMMTTKMMKIKMRMMLSACLTGQSAQLFSYSGERRVLQRSGSIWV